MNEPRTDPQDDPQQPTPARPQPEHRPAQTINEGSVVDEAAYESFPASDAPSWTGSQSGPPPTPSEDDEEEPERG